MCIFFSFVLIRLNLSFNLIQTIEGLESINELIEVSFAVSVCKIKHNFASPIKSSHICDEITFISEQQD